MQNDGLQQDFSRFLKAFWRNSRLRPEIAWRKMVAWCGDKLCLSLESPNYPSSLVEPIWHFKHSPDQPSMWKTMIYWRKVLYKCVWTRRMISMLTIEFFDQKTFFYTPFGSSSCCQMRLKRNFSLAKNGEWQQTTYQLFYLRLGNWLRGTIWRLGSELCV